MPKNFVYLFLILISVDHLLGSDELSNEFAGSLSIAMRWLGQMGRAPRKYKLETILEEMAKRQDGKALAQMLNQQMQPGDTWLKFAIYDFSSIKSVALFIKYGADVSVQDERGATPAQYLLHDLLHPHPESKVSRQQVKFDLLKKEKDRQDLRWLWMGLAQTGRAIDIKPIKPVAPETISFISDLLMSPVVSAPRQACTKSKCCSLQ